MRSRARFRKPSPRTGDGWIVSSISAPRANNAIKRRLPNVQTEYLKLLYVVFQLKERRVDLVSVLCNRLEVYTTAISLTVSLYAFSRCEIFIGFSRCSDSTLCILNEILTDFILVVIFRKSFDCYNF